MSWSGYVVSYWTGGKRKIRLQKKAWATDCVRWLEPKRYHYYYGRGSERVKFNDGEIEKFAKVLEAINRLWENWTISVGKIQSGSEQEIA